MSTTMQLSAKDVNFFNKQPRKQYDERLKHSYRLSEELK